MWTVASVRSFPGKSDNLMVLKSIKMVLASFLDMIPPTITITLINPILLAKELLDDLYKLGKAIWNASFKIYLAYKNFVLGVVKVLQDIVGFLFG